MKASNLALSALIAAVSSDPFAAAFAPASFSNRPWTASNFRHVASVVVSPREAQLLTQLNLSASGFIGMDEDDEDEDGTCRVVLNANQTLILPTFLRILCRMAHRHIGPLLFYRRR